MVKKLLKCILTVWLLTIIQLANCQNINFTHLFNSTVQGNPSTNKNMSLSSLINLARSGNPINFLEFGYFINANNLQYQNTGNRTYLTNNMKLIAAIDGSSSNSNKKISGNVWKLKSAKTARRSIYEDKEFALYEGYLFRYIGEFLYIAKLNSFSTGEHIFR